MADTLATVHGEWPAFVIKSMTSDRYGVFDIIVEREVDSQSYADVFPYELAFITGAPDIGVNVPCTGVTFAWTEGKYVFTYKYEGVQSNYSFDDRRTQYELDVATSQEDIRTHPDFLTLQSIYGTYNESTGGWPKSPPANTTDNTDVGTYTDPNGQTQKKNPLYGVSSYLMPKVVWRRITVSGVIDSSIYKALGCIDTPPTPVVSGPLLPSNATWLKTDVRAQWRGNIWQITEEWTGSGRFGWNKNIYRKTS